jgi:hypothetical protein
MLESENEEEDHHAVEDDEEGVEMWSHKVSADSKSLPAHSLPVMMKTEVNNITWCDDPKRHQIRQDKMFENVSYCP